MSKGKKFANPMLDMAVADDEVVEAADDLQRFEGEKVLDNEDLADLAFAFEACDLDEGGTIDSEELTSVLKVFGAKLSPTTVKTLMTSCKAGNKKAQK